MTGWRQAEARGKPLEEVFRIVNEDTREPVENPVARVVREGLVVGLANHTVLIDRTGREHSIADSGAPIKDEAGAILGVVLVFRDVTGELRNRREHETTLQLLRLLNEQNLTHELIQNITGLLQAWTGCEAVGVRLKEGDDFPVFRDARIPCRVCRGREVPVRARPGRPRWRGTAREIRCSNACAGTSCAVVSIRESPFSRRKGSFWSNGTTDTAGQHHGGGPPGPDPQPVQQPGL